MIDLMENKVLGPLIQQKFEQGLQQGEHAGQQKLLREQLAEKFGPLPAWAVQRLLNASSADLHLWSKRILRSATLEDTLG